MKDYIVVRTEREAALRAGGMPATILRPWYALGPGHRWPLVLAQAYWIAKHSPASREAAGRLGLLTIDEMLNAMVWAVEHPAETIRVLSVPAIRLLADGKR
jgi:uncharacterized protein YbjT (DUF2867 family)